MRHVLFALALCTSLPAQADTALDAQAFEQLTLGRTFTYAENGTAYGAEEYLPGRRVRWSFLDGQCKAGFWWEEAGQICFAYEDNPEPQCWRFFMGEAGLVAHYTSSDDAAPLYEVGQSSDPLLCLGPETGV
jgi:hypothetical protein